MDWGKFIGISIVVIFYFFCLIPYIREVNTKYCNARDFRTAKTLLIIITTAVTGIVIFGIATTSFV